MHKAITDQIMESFFRLFSTESTDGWRRR